MASLGKLNRLINEYNDSCIEVLSACSKADITVALRKRSLAGKRLLKCCNKLPKLVWARDVKLQLAGGIRRMP